MFICCLYQQTMKFPARSTDVNGTFAVPKIVRETDGNDCAWTETFPLQTSAGIFPDVTVPNIDYGSPLIIDSSCS